MIVGAATATLFLHASETHPLNSQIWSFTGLSRDVRPSPDLLPLAPWFALTLSGGALARRWPLSAGIPTPLAAVLAWPGRFSLVMYLGHQPVLICIMWLVVEQR
ncbi:DUF1624 domain-containing protein [Roseobacter ponti]|uniref:DUF1624 domain-containing protein n=1 Tax=Roseobacter ponti TaxID=1891787 RepID=A0A858SUX7_9RHOB|nr:DUF1624 domain-containing protein [Roseobacter ponti]